MSREDRDRLGIGIGPKNMAELLELPPQRLEILDDTVVDDRDLVGGDRMSIGLGRAAVCRPSRVTDADRPLHRLVIEPPSKIGELAFGAAAFDATVDQRRYSSRIVTAIFEPPE